MTPFTFYSTIYNLPFVGMIFTGMTLALLLAFAKRPNRKANLFLSLALGCVILNGCGFPVLLTGLGPLLYFYVRQLTSPARLFKRKDLLHFCPLLIAYWLPVCPVLIAVIIYLYLSHRSIQGFYKRIQPVLMDRPRFAFRWLDKVLFLLGLCCVLALFNHLSWLAIAFVLIGMAADAILKPDSGVQQLMPITDRSDAREKSRRLKEAVAANRLYEDAELTLTTLAVKLNIHPHDLSRIINVGLEKNFSDFINEFRVREVARKMQDPAYDRFTLLGIAYESGFNSKRTFNRVFKELTGKTPVEYKNSLGKEGPINKLAPLSQIRPVILRSESPPNWAPEKLNRNFMFRNYLKIACRNLWKNKAFSVINIVGLSVGLACCMLIFLYAMDEVSYDRFHVNASNIYHLVVDTKSSDGEIHKTSVTGDVPGPSFKQQLPEILDFVRIQSNDYTVKRGNEVFDQSALMVDSNFFSVFTFQVIEGNAQIALKDIHSVVLSEETAEKYFGRQNPVGKTLDIKVDDKFQPFIVTAVIKKSPHNSSIKIQMLLPKKLNPIIYAWFNFSENTFLVIKPGADIKKLCAKMNSIYMRDAARDIKMASKFGWGKITYGLQPLLAMHTSTDYPVKNGLVDNSNPIYSYILSGIALFILIIACINFVNLTVARSLKRAKEIGIRKIAGARRRQLIMQFLGESIILSFIAFALATILVQLALPFFNTLANKALAFSYLFSFKLVAGYTGIFLLTSLLAGFYPALVLSAFNPVQALYNRNQYAGKNYLSKGLVILQFTLATFLIISTIIIYSQFNYLMRFDLGYNDRNVVSITAFGLDKQKLALFKNELLKDPFISSVTADQGERYQTIAHINNGQQIQFDMKHIDEDYLPLFRVPVVKGRNFSKTMLSDSANSILVNEEFVKQAGWKSPIGQVVDFFYKKRKYNVVGIVKDYHFLSLTESTPPTLFTMKPDYTWGNIFVRISDKNRSESLGKIQKEFKAGFPFIPYQYKFKDAEVAEQYDKEAKWKKIVTFGAILTIFISCIGLFGLATLSAERRKKEIGIRKVFGASVEDIVRKLSADFAKLVLISAMISAPAARWAMYKWLENYPYKIDVNAWIFLGATVFVLLIALITVSFQTIRAAVANPVKSLRSE